MRKLLVTGEIPVPRLPKRPRRARKPMANPPIPITAVTLTWFEQLAARIYRKDDVTRADVELLGATYQAQIGRILASNGYAYKPDWSGWTYVAAPYSPARPLPRVYGTPIRSGPRWGL